MSTFSDRLRYHTATLDRPLFCEAADRIDEAAAFLDGMADRLAPIGPPLGQETADCRVMAKRLRGET
jgi:hypothetical protein